MKHVKITGFTEWVGQRELTFHVQTEFNMNMKLLPQILNNFTIWETIAMILDTFRGGIREQMDDE